MTEILRQHCESLARGIFRAAALPDLHTRGRHLDRNVVLGAVLATDAAATRASRLTVREALAYL
ncbi:MAG: hypothetical protein ACRDVN_14380 [Jiangellaceae bacterium]